MTKQSQTLLETRKLLNDTLANAKREQNTGVRLAISIYNAIRTGEIDDTHVKAFGKGTSKKRAGKILEDLASFYSDVFAQALEDQRNKENSKEIRELADKQIRVIKKAMTNALFIGGYCYERKIEAVNMSKQGDIVLVIGKEDDDKETYSWNTALKLAKKHYGRTGKGLGREEHASDDTPTMPLITALNSIDKLLTGKTAKDFAHGETKAAMQHAFIALAGILAADSEGALDVSAVQRLYNEAA